MAALRQGKKASDLGMKRLRAGTKGQNWINSQAVRREKNSAMRKKRGTTVRAATNCTRSVAAQRMLRSAGVTVLGPSLELAIRT